MKEAPCGSVVMVVDDDVDLREALIELLQDNDYRVVGASNGREALDLLHRMSERPCVILLDVMMPVMDGKTFHSELVKEPDLSRIPVLVLSAHANPDDLFPEQTVEAKLRKPVEIGQLLTLVARWCSPSA